MISVDNYVKRTGSGDVKITFNDNLSQVMVSTVSSEVMKPIRVEMDAKCCATKVNKREEGDAFMITS
jgi:hypothetical protein